MGTQLFSFKKENFQLILMTFLKITYNSIRLNIHFYLYIPLSVADIRNKWFNTPLPFKINLSYNYLSI